MLNANNLAQDLNSGHRVHFLRRYNSTNSLSTVSMVGMKNVKPLIKAKGKIIVVACMEPQVSTDFTHCFMPL